MAKKKKKVKPKIEYPEGISPFSHLINNSPDDTIGPLSHWLEDDKTDKDYGPLSHWND